MAAVAVRMAAMAAARMAVMAEREAAATGVMGVVAVVTVMSSRWRTGSSRPISRTLSTRRATVQASR